MTIEQMRARIGEIEASLTELNGVENLTDENVATIEALSNEFEDLTKKIEAKERLASITNKASSAPRKTGANANANSNVTVVGNPLDKTGGFENAGEFFMAVRNHAGGKRDSRFENSMFEKHGEQGGFLVPETFITEVTKKINSDESLLGKTNQMQISGNGLTLPVDETQPWNSGVQAYWTSEGQKIKDSALSMGQASWRLHKLAAMVKATDELLEDAVALESYIRNSAPTAIMHKLNEAILFGDGVGKPNGLINSPFKVKVAKEGGQVADTIEARNVIKMFNRMIPTSRARAVWYINPMCEDQLRTMKDDQGNFIYLAPGSQMNQGPYGLLMGRPVIPMLGNMKALGDEGDIIFADLSYFYSIYKTGGIKGSVSQHLYFDQDISAFKFTMRIDGKCPFQAPVTTEHGNYEMSAFITLEDRA